MQELKPGVLYTFKRSSITSETGIMLGQGRELIVIAVLDGFRFDGYSVFNKSDITSFTSGDRESFVSHVFLAKNNKTCSMPFILNVENWKGCLKSLFNQGETIAIEMEDASEFQLGRIAGIQKENVHLLCITSEGIVEEKPYTIPIQEVSKIAFMSSYIQNYATYARSWSNKNW